MNKYDGIKRATVTVSRSLAITNKSLSKGEGEKPLPFDKGKEYEESVDIRPKASVVNKNQYKNSRKSGYLRGLLLRTVAAALVLVTVFAYKALAPRSEIVSGIREAIAYESERAEELREAVAELIK